MLLLPVYLRDKEIGFSFGSLSVRIFAGWGMFHLFRLLGCVMHSSARVQGLGLSVL